MRKATGFLTALGILSLVLVALPATAAQRGIVDADNVDLLQGPLNNASSLRKLKKGTPLDVSNFPTEGFYKVRTPEKEIGWVQADAIDLKKVPEAQP